MNKLIAMCGLMILLVSAPILALSTDDEIQIGARAASQFEQQYGLDPNQAMQERLQGIGQKLLGAAQRKNLPWRFRVIAIDEFNAAAFPGGFIYATRGLMEGLNDEELAFVIAHEIAHVDQRHIVRQIEQAQLARLGTLAVLIGANRSLDIPQSQAMIANLANAVIQSGHSREHESEADRYGAMLMSHIGYDPVYSVLALDQLSKQAGGGTPGFLNTLLGSHPLPKDRVEEASNRVLDLPFHPAPDPPVAAPNSGPTPTVFLEDRTLGLQRSLELAGLTHDRQLQAKSRQIATTGQRRGVVKTFPARASLSTVESELLKNDLRPGNRFGVTVTRASDGGQRVTLIAN